MIFSTVEAVLHSLSAEKNRGQIWHLLFCPCFCWFMQCSWEGGEGSVCVCGGGGGGRIFGPAFLVAFLVTPFSRGLERMFS